MALSVGLEIGHSAAATRWLYDDGRAFLPLQPTSTEILGREPVLFAGLRQCGVDPELDLLAVSDLEVADDRAPNGDDLLDDLKGGA